MAKATFTPGTDAAQASAAETAAPSQVVETSEAGKQTFEGLKPDEIRAILREELDARDRAIQSARDKQEARFNQRFTSLENAFTAAGVQLTDAQRDSLRKQAVKEVLQEEPASPSQGGKQEPEQPAAPSKEVQAAWAVMEDEGIDIDEADPEADLIDWSSPAKARRTTLAAIDAKRARLARGRNPVVGGGPGTSKAALERELQELIAHPNPRNNKRMKELEAQLR